MRPLKGLFIRRQSSLDPIEMVQNVLSKEVASTLCAFTDAFDEMMQKEIWQKRGSVEEKIFATFGDFAIAPQPDGLGARTERTFFILRRELIGGGYMREFTDYLERVVRERGRPRKNLANSEDFPRFRRVPTSMTSLERMLLTLKRAHPEVFADMCAHKLSARQAAIQVGLIVDSGGPRRFGVCNYDAAKRLRHRAQGKLLCDLFHILSVDAQCTLLSRHIEPRLGPGLAKRWREERAQMPIQGDA